MRYLGIDYGGRYVGLAIGDDETHLALPLATIETTPSSDIVADIKKYITSEMIDSLVVGIPSLGTPHKEQENITHEFVERLRTEIGLPVETIDESFTSKHAETLLREAGNTKDNHSTAAMLILQTYIDKKSQ